MVTTSKLVKPDLCFYETMNLVDKGTVIMSMKLCWAR